MKQFLVVKVAQELGEAAMSLIPLPGVFTREAAEQVIRKLAVDDPAGKFLMQEIGVA